MNRLGIMVDVSHIPRLSAVMKLSKTPVMRRTRPAGFTPAGRNMSDDTSERRRPGRRHSNQLRVRLHRSRIAETRTASFGEPTPFWKKKGFDWMIR
jgi:hypothetical protein